MFNNYKLKKEIEKRIEDRKKVIHFKAEREIKKLRNQLDEMDREINQLNKKLNKLNDIFNNNQLELEKLHNRESYKMMPARFIDVENILKKQLVALQTELKKVKDELENKNSGYLALKNSIDNYYEDSEKNDFELNKLYRELEDISFLKTKVQ